MANFNINAVTIGLGGSFYTPGNQTFYFPEGTWFLVTGSSGNNGNYVVQNSSTSGPNTKIDVLPTQNIPNSIADGQITNLGYKAFKINFSDPLKPHFFIPPQVIDNSTSLTLPGQGKFDYGELMDENILHILENFSRNIPPGNPIEGQLWYNSATSELNIWDSGWNLVNINSLNNLYVNVDGDLMTDVLNITQNIQLNNLEQHYKIIGANAGAGIFSDSNLVLNSNILYPYTGAYPPPNTLYPTIHFKENNNSRFIITFDTSFSQNNLDPNYLLIDRDIENMSGHLLLGSYSVDPAVTVVDKVGMKVGIGKKIPTSKLHVYSPEQISSVFESSSDISSKIKLNNADVSYSWNFGIASSLHPSIPNNYFFIENGNNSIIPFVISDNGDIGIGTNIPNQISFLPNTRSVHISSNGGGGLILERISNTARKWGIGITTGGSLSIGDETSSNSRVEIDVNGRTVINGLVNGGLFDDTLPGIYFQKQTSSAESNIPFIRAVGDATTTHLTLGSTSSSGEVRIFTNASEKLRIDSVGKISTGGDSIEINALGTGNRYAYIDFHGDDTNVDYSARILKDNTGVNSDLIIVNRGTGNFYIESADAGSLVLKTSAIDRFKILPTGEIQTGIGFLELNALTTGARDSYIDFHNADAQDYGARLHKVASGGTDSDFFVANKGIGNLILRQEGAGQVFIQTNSLSRIIVNNVGNVTIGSSAPTQKLDVEGSIRISSGGILRSTNGAAGTPSITFDSNLFIGLYNSVSGLGISTSASTAGSYRFSLTQLDMAGDGVTKKKIINLEDPTSNFDAVNLQTLNNRVVFADSPLNNTSTTLSITLPIGNWVIKVDARVHLHTWNTAVNLFFNGVQLDTSHVYADPPGTSMQPLTGITSLSTAGGVFTASITGLGPTVETPDTNDGNFYRKISIMAWKIS